jgi:hypothetical protein
MQIYGDLRAQHIYAANEPEFTAYMMLLADNENHLKLMLSLPPHIAKSDIIQFVIKVSFFFLCSSQYFLIKHSLSLVLLL